MDKPWKLGKDMHPNDTILDPVTFDDLITALRCGEKVINRTVVKNVAKDIVESRMEDFTYLLLNNIDEIMAEAMKGR